MLQIESRSKLLIGNRETGVKRFFTIVCCGQIAYDTGEMVFSHFVSYPTIFFIEAHSRPTTLASHTVLVALSYLELPCRTLVPLQKSRQLCNNTSKSHTSLTLQFSNGKATSSYVEDPKWQRKFSMVWAITVAIAIVLSARHFIRAIYQGRAFTGLFGVSEDNTGESYTPINVEEKVPIHSKRRIAGFAHSVLALFSWTLPGVELSFGQSEYIVCHGTNKNADWFS